MASTAQKSEFLQEHLRYEVMMLRHTYGRLLTTTNQLDWNAFFVAFSTHARSLFDFLTDSTDSRSFKASDFVDDFSLPDPTRIRQKVRRLDPQVLHTGKSRKKEADQKFNLHDATAVFNWIEKGFSKFQEKLPADFAKDWMPPKPVMAVDESVARPRGWSRQTISTLSTTTSETFVSFKGYPPKKN
jgi:hypothetical protein